MEEPGSGEKTFPQEARLEDAVSYAKGCYIGQEIIARIHSRGAVNRVLVRLALDAEVPAGTKLSAQGRSTGSITSAAVSPTNGAIALGYVKREDAEQGHPLDAEGVAARIR